MRTKTSIILKFESGNKLMTFQSPGAYWKPLNIQDEPFCENRNDNTQIGQCIYKA